MVQVGSWSATYAVQHPNRAMTSVLHQKYDICAPSSFLLFAYFEIASEFTALSAKRMQNNLF
jgi:hypothetical protein